MPSHQPSVLVEVIEEKRVLDVDHSPTRNNPGLGIMTEIVYADALEHGVLADPLPRLR